MAKNKADYYGLNKEHLLKKIIDSQCITFRTSVAFGPSDDLRPSLTWSMENWHDTFYHHLEEGRIGSSYLRLAKGKAVLTNYSMVGRPFDEKADAP